MDEKKDINKIYGVNYGIDGDEYVSLPGIQSSKTDYIASLEDARACIKEKNFEEAEEHILEAIDCKMTSEALNLFVINCMNMGRIARAQIYLHKWLKDNKPEEQGILHLCLGTIYETLEQFESAIDHYKAALGYGENDAYFFLGRMYCGLLYISYKDLNAAFFYFDSAYNSELTFSKATLCDLVLKLCNVEGLKDKKEIWEERKTESLQKEFLNSI